MTTRLALLGGPPVRTEPWPTWPQRGLEEEVAVLAALREGDWGGFPMPNERAGRFAEAFARRHDAAYAVCVANGTVSLEIALQALGAQPGAEVIVPAYTFEATASAVLFAGCAPVFADIDPDTWCIDPAAIEAAITSRTQAIVPVHLAMLMADLDAVGEIAQRHGLAVLEDCAHAHGARWRGRGAGSWGDAGSFSFQTSKLMSAGEGGAVTTSRADVLDRLYALANCGRQRPGRERDAPVVGHNYRMTELQAAILEVQLGRLDDQHVRRVANAAILDRGIDGIEGLERPRADERITTRAIYQYVFRFRPEAFGGLDRDTFVAALAAEGVPCDGRFYESLPESPLLRPDPARFPGWTGGDPEACPVARRLAYSEAVWISHHLLLGDARDAEQIVEAIAKVAAGADALRGASGAAIDRLRTARAARS
ncbi:MAG TPA: DegT/DnrJ/EryC1/StrS family aminotransferase [Thermoanaerobaculia bacterium]|nr:DegT/DnrJ/EryC1/StrS family aminotransferase [Thermoanaerobaculia bacterium]